MGKVMLNDLKEMDRDVAWVQNRENEGDGAAFVDRAIFVFALMVFIAIFAIMTL